MEQRVGLPSDGLTRWRCDICSLLNVYSNDECSRCKEPMTKERKEQNKILPPKQMRRQHPVSQQHVQQKRSNQVARYPQKQKKIGKENKRSNTYGFNKKNQKGKISKVSTTTNRYGDKKLKKVDLNEKHLGYKASKKQKVNGFVRSKLNHDTASYRAKLEGKGNPNDIKRTIKGMKKGVQYATIDDLTKNGFQTTLSTKNKNKGDKQQQYKLQKTRASIRKLVDERPVTPPPKGKRGVKRGLLDKLQKAHTGEIMANMRHGGRYMRTQKKRFGSGTTKYAL